MHKRRAILEDIRGQLKAAAGLNGCWIQRGQRNAKYPHCTIFAESESVDTLTIHAPARPQDRQLTVAVVGWVRGLPDDERAEGDMDTVAEIIETVVSIPIDAEDSLLIGSDFEVSEDEPEIHLVKLTYQVSYMTNENDPT
ncbi:MAG: hypothetical protein IBX56_07860 [Methylomicrobium sp.]|nr:hypothetical protein [Methylomicrobium sp.]